MNLSAFSASLNVGFISSPYELSTGTEPVDSCFLRAGEDIRNLDLEFGKLAL